MRKMIFHLTKHFVILKGDQDERICGKYCKCDWGDTCEEDVRSNNEAVKNGERILAAYMYGDTKIWIITEWDRSATTILFPEKY